MKMLPTRCIEFDIFLIRLAKYNLLHLEKEITLAKFEEERKKRDYDNEFNVLDQVAYQ